MNMNMNSMNTISLKAYAKINLALDVIRRREDGYHDVRMIMQTIKLHDKLIMKKTINPGITINSNLSYLSNNENNLVYIAARLFKDAYNIDNGVYIQLEKRIPVSAGMAGGSTDAAAALIGMNELFHTNLSLASLQKLGKKIGADVPYCLLRGTALAEGIGEILTPLPPTPQCYCLIVKPSFGISTKNVYESLEFNNNTTHPDIDYVIEAIKNNDLKRIASSLSNTLEDVVIKEYPVIGNIKSKMLSYGALGSLMSGSGSTVFGLFDDKKKAQKAYYEFKVGEFGKQTYLTDFFEP